MKKSGKIQLKKWIKDKSIVALCGKFSSGKTSIINKILGEKILPVDILPTTAVPTYISYGHEDKNVLLIDSRNNIRKLEVEIFKNIIHTKENINKIPLNFFNEIFCYGSRK